MHSFAHSYACMHSRRKPEAVRSHVFHMPEKTGKREDFQYINSLCLQPVKHVTTVFLLLLCFLGDIDLSTIHYATFGKIKTFWVQSPTNIVFFA